jgi:hypothetical protein
MPVPITRSRIRRLKWAGTEKKGKGIQIGISKKRSKNEYLTAFILRLNRLPAPKTDGLK